jgi:Na+-driven multidrug efflux pump
VGETRTALIVNSLGFWLLGLPVSLFLGFQLGYGPIGLWWGLAAVDVALLAQVRTRLGDEIHRLVVDEQHGLEARAG